MRGKLVFSALVLAASVAGLSTSVTSTRRPPVRTPARFDAFPIMLAKRKKEDLLYRRPSAALEQGGSFFVPGLEGTKLRTGAAAVLSVGLLLNRILSPGEPVSSQYVSEALGVFSCLIVFAQSAAQNRVDAEAAEDALRAAFAARLKERQEYAESLTPLAAERTRWVATTLLKTTPARAAVWVGADGTVLARCGRFPEPTGTDPPPMAPVDAQALRALFADMPVAMVDFDVLSGSGSVPPAPLPRNAVSALLCRCGGEARDAGILAITSEQPAAFSERHSQWLQDCARLLAR